MGAAQPAQARGTGARCAGNLPVRGMSAGDQGPHRREGVTGDAAGPRQVPQCGNNFLVAEDGVHPPGHVRQLPEEVAAAIVAQVLQEAQLRVPWFVVDGRVQGQLRRVGQVQADPSVVSGEGTRSGPENLAGGHEFVEHGGLVVGHPAGQDQGLPG
jgi:hypothetical protein